MKCYCTECNSLSTCSLVDLGIGPTEFWGNVQTDSFLVVETDCCNSTARHRTLREVVIEPKDFEPDLGI